jgi:hypothetical protein
MSLLGDVLGLAKGVAEGAWDGVKGTASGVGHLAEGGYKLATDSHYREQVWNSAIDDANAAANFAATAVTDPGKAADEIGNTASQAWHTLETAYNQAAARGQGSELIGQIFGQGAVLAGTAFIPGGAEADAVGDAGRAATLLDEAGSATELVTDASKTARVTGDVSNAVGITQDADRAAVFEAPGRMGDVAPTRTPRDGIADLLATQSGLTRDAHHGRVGDGNPH